MSFFAALAPAALSAGASLLGGKKKSGGIGGALGQAVLSGLTGGLSGGISGRIQQLISPDRYSNVGATHIAGQNMRDIQGQLAAGYQDRFQTTQRNIIEDREDRQAHDVSLENLRARNAIAGTLAMATAQARLRGNKPSQHSGIQPEETAIRNVNDHWAARVPLVGRTGADIIKSGVMLAPKLYQWFDPDQPGLTPDQREINRMASDRLLFPP